MLLLISPMRRCNNLCTSALFVLWYYRSMDVIFDWNLGNMIYNGLITLRHCGFPFAKIGVTSVGIRAILDHMTKPLEMDDRIGREQPLFRLYTDPAFTFMQGLSIYWPANTYSLNMQMATNVEWPPLGPLPLDHAKLTFDLCELGGFAQTLCWVLIMLGVPDKLVKVTCIGRPA